MEVLWEGWRESGSGFMKEEMEGEDEGGSEGWVFDRVSVLKLK